jgi:predicted nucleotidyltransferase
MKQGFLIRMDEADLRRLQARAKKSGVSINMYINQILSDHSTPVSKSARDSSSQFLKPILEASFSSELVAILLFGSVAKGFDSESSDVDLLLVMDSRTKITRSLYATWDKEIEGRLDRIYFDGREVSPHFTSLPKDLADFHGLWLEVAISGIVLWRKDNRVDNLLINIRTEIASGAFKRKESHGHPYWLRE